MAGVKGANHFTGKCDRLFSRSALRKRIFALSAVFALVLPTVFAVPFFAAGGTIGQTQEEQAFIKAHPVIRLAVDPGFVPFEFINEDGEYVGITADYLKIIGEKTGLRFEVVKGLTWPEAYDLALSGGADVLPAVGKTSVHKEIVDTLIDTLHSRYPREKEHSAAVSELCAEIGTALNLPETEMSKLKRAGFVHDIGKIVLDSAILNKDYLSFEELETVQQHSVVGFRILNLFDDKLDLAEYVYAHHERWDGTGYPRGLKGEQIPLISRIIAVVETYERVLNRGNLSPEERKAAALDTIREHAGTQFDPQIALLFIAVMEKRNRKE